MELINHVFRLAEQSAVELHYNLWKPLQRFNKPSHMTGVP